MPKPTSLADPAKDRAERLAAANKAAEDLNAKLQGWTYTVPPYIFSNFHKNLDELLKPLESKSAPKKPAAPILPAQPASRP